MNRFAAILLAALLTFVAGYSWHSWNVEKEHIVNEQENVLAFVSRHVDGFLERIESGFVRLSYEITEGAVENPGQINLLIGGLKNRNRDFLGVSLTSPDGKYFATDGMPQGEKQPIDRLLYKDTEKKPGVYLDYWNTRIEENHHLIIEPPDEAFAHETHTLAATYHHQDERGLFRHSLTAILRMTILQDYWQTTETLKKSALWIVTDGGQTLALHPRRRNGTAHADTMAGVLVEFLNRVGFPRNGKLDLDTGDREEPQLAVYQRLENYPFTAVILVPRAEILAKWRDRVQVPLLLSSILLMFGLVAYRKILSDQRARQIEDRRVQEQMRISNERWKAALDCASAGLWELDFASEEIRVSGTTLNDSRFPNVERNVALGSWFDLVHPEDRQTLKDAISSFTLGVQPEFKAELRILCDDGKWKWFAVRGNATAKDDDGKPLRALGTITDVTLQKSALLQLLDSKKRLRQGFDLFPTGVAVLAENGSVVDANPALGRMFGYSGKEMIGMPFEQFFNACRPDGKGCQLIFPLGEEFYGASLERVAKHKSGHRFSVIYKLLSVSAGSGAGTDLIVQIEDLSERKQAHLHDSARVILDAQEKDRAEISRELHDEIGQLLTALRMILKQAHDNPGNAANIVDWLGRGLRVLNDTVDCVRSISNRMRPVAIDQLGLIPALRSHISKNVRSLGQKVSFTENLGERRLPGSMELCCFRVVQEALTNCLRHANAANIDVIVTFEVSRLMVAVKDDGNGFDIGRYYASRSESASLGLIGMHERVSANRGELQIRSKPGHGTEVTALFDLNGALP